MLQGFRDLLHIANQSRPNIFDLEIRMPENLYEDVVEVDEEVGLPLRNGPLRRSGGVEHDWYEAAAVRSVNLDRESVAVRRPVDVDALKGDLRAVKEKGITSLAVVLKHAALFPDHERLVGDVAKEMGFAQVRVSVVVVRLRPLFDVSNGLRRICLWEGLAIHGDPARSELHRRQSTPSHLLACLLTHSLPLHANRSPCHRPSYPWLRWCPGDSRPPRMRT